jgi:type II secretory pathway component PulC
MRDGVSPEEKLLRLIRAPKNNQDFPKDKNSTVSNGAPKIKSSLRILIYSLLQKHLSFSNIRKITLFLLVVSCIYLVISLVYPWIGLKRIVLPKVTPEKIVQPKIERKQEIKPFEFYREGIGNRQIFSSAPTQGTGIPASGINVNIMKDINLVGIISGENPQAIIEDKKTQKTYYVTKGQFIGEFQIEDIQEGKIILNYNGQRFELYL